MAWAAFQIADSCMVNKQITHVACWSHKLRLEVRRMCERDIVLAETFRSIGKTKTACKSKLNNRAIIRDVISLFPFLPNDTGWSRLDTMINVSTSCSARSFNWQKLKVRIYILTNLCRYVTRRYASKKC